MNIIILGAGRVGESVAESLASERNDITVIDTDPARSTEAGMSGVAQVTGERFTGLNWYDAPINSGFRRGWVNLTVPNDPWPAAYDLTINWTCSVAAP